MSRGPQCLFSCCLGPAILIQRVRARIGLVGRLLAVEDVVRRDIDQERVWDLVGKPRKERNATNVDLLREAAEVISRFNIEFVIGEGNSASW